ncbi:serine hydrolase domain-containing protein [Kitasatospora sp. CMC57]|uniref:Serine hydrolase domain-containing protein n=1 Tax=Kitasatospora sp. CMC57 TaxID=3231513 RepID=A0AB33JQ70_9ACTN
MREQTWQRFLPSRQEDGRQRVGRRGAGPAVAVLAVGVLTVSAVPSPSTAFATKPDTVQQALSALVRSDGLPAALATVQDGTGRSRNYTAGVGDLATGAKVPVDGQVRIGSNTKTFTAVVVLQLVGEGKVDLDEHVDTYLPGLVRGEGLDGSRITVRQLLQHTSGIPDYEGLLDEASLRYRYFEPRELLDLALQHRAEFTPGERFGYSSTNYVLAGLIVQRVTGRPLAEEIDRRVVQRIGLRHTYFPAAGDRTIREAHPKGYRRDTAGGPLLDFTEMDPSAGWAAGQMISTNSDVNQFFTALLAGRLLPDAQLTQMRTTVPIGDSGAGYGLGIMRRPLSCGGVYWGHGGDIPGYETRGGVTEDGRAANVAVTYMPTDRAGAEHVEAVVDTALCRTR